jgi:molecular chaperone DnaK (HSP70)
MQENVDDLIVVGGASRMPWLRKALRNHFPQRTAMHMTDAAINAVHTMRSAL